MAVGRAGGNKVGKKKISKFQRVTETCRDHVKYHAVTTRVNCMQHAFVIWPHSG